MQQPLDQSFSWTDNDGIHFAAPGSPPSPERLEKMTKEYQKQIRNSPLWDEIVKDTEKRKLKNY